MRKSIYLILIVLTACILSCKKETNNPTPGGTLPISTNKFEFTMDGVHYSYTDFTVEDLGDFIHLSRHDSLDNYFAFNFDENIPEGQYDFGFASGMWFFIAYNTAQFEGYESGGHTGSVYIAKHDTVNNFIRGNFHCPVSYTDEPNDTKQISEGKFSYYYPE